LFYASFIWVNLASWTTANPLWMYGIPLAFLMFGMGLTNIIYNFENDIVLYIIFLLLLALMIATVITKKKRQREFEKENRNRRLRKNQRSKKN